MGAGGWDLRFERALDLRPSLSWVLGLIFRVGVVVFLVFWWLLFVVLLDRPASGIFGQAFRVRVRVFGVLGRL